MLAGSKVEMSRSEKKGNGNTSNKISCEHNNIFSIKRATRKFQVATTRAKKKGEKKCAAGA